MKEKHENSYCGGEKMRMLGATEVKMSGSEKKSEQKHICLSSKKSVTRKFHVVVEQNNGKDIHVYQKVCCACKDVFPR